MRPLAIAVTCLVGAMRVGAESVSSWENALPAQGDLLTRPEAIEVDNETMAAVIEAAEREGGVPNTYIPTQECLQVQDE